MSDWTGLFNSDDFRAYRKKQAELGAFLIKRSVKNALWGNPAATQEMKGQLDTIMAFLKLPETLTEDEGTKANLEQQLQDDLNNITKYLMREALRE